MSERDTVERNRESIFAHYVELKRIGVRDPMLIAKVEWVETMIKDTKQSPPENEDICGLCGLPGADKVVHPHYWPGERRPGTEYVHARCEEAECGRACAALTEKQREEFLLKL